MSTQRSTSQLSLFTAAPERIVVDDDRGRIVYTPDFVPAELACAWFDQLRDEVRRS